MVTESPGQAVAKPAKPARTRRATRVGVVTTAVCEKTIKVTVSYLVRHPKYGKLLRRRSVLHAHDEKKEAHQGDVVEVVACRPLSKTKHWRLLRVVEKSHTYTPGGDA
jgi:small subunit ribosomal protein S17